MNIKIYYNMFLKKEQVKIRKCKHMTAVMLECNVKRHVKAC